MTKICLFPQAPAFGQFPWNGDFTVTTFKERWSWGFRIQNTVGEIVRTGTGHHNRATAWSEGVFALHNIQPTSIPA
jgi:hypothetical protein